MWSEMGEGRSFFNRCETEITLRRACLSFSASPSQGFLKHFLSLSDASAPETMDTASSFPVEESAPKPNTILAPSPRPIASTMVVQNTASPRPLSSGIAWSPASPSIPSLPSVPSPRTPRTYVSPESTEVPIGWSFCLSREQFSELLRVNEEEGGECPLTHCLGCLSLFYQFLTTAQTDKQVQVRGKGLGRWERRKGGGESWGERE